MEFKNPQHWIGHHSAQLKANPIAAFLFTLLFLVLLLPLLGLALLALVLFLVTLPFRIAWAQWRMERAGGKTPRPPDGDAPAGPRSGPVIDVEVTRSSDGG